MISLSENRVLMVHIPSVVRQVVLSALQDPIALIKMLVLYLVREGTIQVR